MGFDPPPEHPEVAGVCQPLIQYLTSNFHQYKSKLPAPHFPTQERQNWVCGAQPNQFTLSSNLKAVEQERTLQSASFHIPSFHRPLVCSDEGLSLQRRVITVQGRIQTFWWVLHSSIHSSFINEPLLCARPCGGLWKFLKCLKLIFLSSLFH